MIVLHINIDFEFNTLPNKKLAECISNSTTEWGRTVTLSTIVRQITAIYSLLAYLFRYLDIPSYMINVKVIWKERRLQWS